MRVVPHCSVVKKADGATHTRYNRSNCGANGSSRTRAQKRAW